MLKVDIHHLLGGFSLNATFEAPKGISVLFGRSGSGKTTIINAIAGLIKPKSGHITLDGQTLTGGAKPVPVHKRRLGYIFQEARLFPHLTVRQNLIYGRRFITPGLDTPRLEEVVDLLGLSTFLDRRTPNLSGGEKQRVAIGRALMSDPKMLLADEPLASLDEARKADILPYFERLRDQLGLPILYVTHSPTEVARLADTVIAVENGQIARQGSAFEILGDPDVTPVGVRGAGAVIQAQITAHHEDGLTELNAGGVALLLPYVAQPIGTKMRLRIAAQDVVLSTTKPTGLSALNVVPGTIRSIREGEGPGAMVALDTAAGQILARVTRRSVGLLGLSPGQRCHAVLKSVAIAPQDISGQG